MTSKVPLVRCFDRRVAAFWITCLCPLAAADAQVGSREAPPMQANALTSMPVKELAVFKDGHAFVMHEADMPVAPGGDVILDGLPTPVLGTFWPYAADANAKLRSVVAAERRVRTDEDALLLSEMLEANVGAAVRIMERDAKEPYDAFVIGIPKRAPATDLPRVADESSLPPSVPTDQSDLLVLLKVDGGTKALPLNLIRDVTFVGEPKTKHAVERRRKLMTLNLDWAGKPLAKTAKVGMVYLQKGVRWIPGYRVEIDGKGAAKIQLQATIINELADFDAARLHLVIGVPSFFFKDTLDPIGLQETAVRLSQYFQTGQMAGAMSNAIQTQVYRSSEFRGGQGAAGPSRGGGDADGDPSAIAASREEDLFVFEVASVSLRKGERMVLPVAEFDLPYEDVFALDLPFSPPAEVQCNVSGERLEELQQLLNSPRVQHRIRLTNNSKFPLTTAPAIILRDKRLVAQGMMTYTSIGAKGELEVTTAIDIQVRRSDLETKRTPHATFVAGDPYLRIDLAGTISLTNHRSIPVKIEVTRHVLGDISEASHEGKIERGGLFDADRRWGRGTWPYWWGWYSWPRWWSHANGLARAKWTVALEPDQSTELSYKWSYFWR